MTRKKNKLLKDVLFWLLILSLLFGTIAYVLMYITPNVNAFPVPNTASTDNDYVFSNNIYYNDEPEISVFNQRNQTQDSGNFSGTESFQYEIVGTESTDIEFMSIDTSGADCGFIIVDSVGIHDKVLKMYDDNAPLYAKGYANITVQTSGSIEFWVQFNNVTADGYSYFNIENRAGTETIIEIRFKNNGEISYFDGHDHLISSYVVDTWYHFRIDIETSNMGYIGLGTDKFDLYLDCILEVDGGDFKTLDCNSFGRFRLETTTVIAKNDYFVYYDAFGYSWDENYTIGDNLIPYYAPTNVLEADKWEFAFDGYNRIPEGQFPAYPYVLESGWQSGIITDYILIENDGFVDNQVIFNQSSASLISALYNLFNYESATSWYELNFKLTFNDFSATEEFLWFYIKDSWNDDIIKLQMSKEYLKLYNHDTSSYQDSYNVSQVLGEYLLTLYWSDIGSKLYLFINDTFVDCTYLDSATGINRLSFYTDNDVSSAQAFYIDYVSLYENGISLSTEIGGVIATLSTEPLNFNYLNFFEITMIGNVSIEISGSELFPLDYYNGTYFLNLQNQDIYSLGGTLLIQANGDYNISNIYIHGVLLTEGLNEYYPTYSTSNVNVTESYFYADSNNRLQYSLTTNDTNLEYISISFDIINLASMNRSIVFSRLKSDVLAFSEFRLYYSDSTYTSFISSTSISGVNSILPQSKVISSFYVLITDSDNDLNTTLTGYFSSITLVYNPNIQTTISTLSLLGIIPLLFLLVFVPFIMYMKFKNAIVVIPTFILMTIVGITSGLLPNWVGAVLIIGSVLTYLIKREVMD